MANFECVNAECIAKNKSVASINEYKIKYDQTTGKTICIDRITGKKIVCEYCGTPLENVREFDGFCTNVSFFNSMTADQKKEALKKRANKAFDKNTDSMKDYRNALDRNEIS